MRRAVRRARSNSQQHLARRSLRNELSSALDIRRIYRDYFYTCPAHRASLVAARAMLRFTECIQLAREIFSRAALEESTLTDDRRKIPRRARADDVGVESMQLLVSHLRRPSLSLSFSLSSSISAFAASSRHNQAHSSATFLVIPVASDNNVSGSVRRSVGRAARPIQREPTRRSCAFVGRVFAMCFSKKRKKKLARRTRVER